MENTKPITHSKINWVAVLSMLTMPFAMFGLDFPPEKLAVVAVVINGAWGFITMIFRTFDTNSTLKGFFSQAENVLIMIGDMQNPQVAGRYRDLDQALSSGKAQGIWRAVDLKTGKTLISSVPEE
jgi:hypothetical protein